MLQTFLLVLLLTAAALAQPTTPEAAASPVPTFSATYLTLNGADGTPLEARLTLPARVAGGDPVPVVFFLHGAGARTYDNTFLYRGPDGKPAVGRFLDYHADQLARRGIALFSISKRGCAALAEPPGMKVDREVFSKATLSVIIDDYAQALAVLRARPEVDPSRIILVGSSEGTRAAPILARRAPDGIAGIVMMAYAVDNARKTVEWQNTIGPWRNVQHLIPAARDGVLTRDEHAEFVKEHAQYAAALPFDGVDADKDDRITEQDLLRINTPRLDAIVKAVETRDDEFLWKNLMRLSSAYLLDWWDAEPNKENLLALDIPLAIYHGDLDGTCRVEGVRETEAAFAAAGKTNLKTFLYPDANHDLNWTQKSLQDGGPQPYQDAFDYIAVLARGGSASKPDR
jgi:pimeloyl-ACP methyl ester carboxylesterase